MRQQIEDARERYRPDGSIDLLFIAEAPPADPSRYFYFDRVQQHDWLYLSLMRALFSDARELDAASLRNQKPDYLARFCDSGFYLLDASDAPMRKGATDAEKREHLAKSIQELVARVGSLIGPETRVVLISKSVFDVCCAPLRAAGVRVVNTEMIDFPSSGRQKIFDHKMRAALRDSDEHLQATVRALEASLEYFGAGESKKRERERWVVERFLRALCLQFDASEIEQPERDPPDARFRGASFEVKELLQPNRRRSDEYRDSLARARSAVNFAELTHSFTPQDLPLADAYRLIMEETQMLAAKKYVVAGDRERLDLLFYLNLGMDVAWDIEDGPRPSVAPLVAEGWRSVSFLHGSRTACVVYCRDSAPIFLRSNVGRLIDPHR